MDGRIIFSGSSTKASNSLSTLVSEGLKSSKNHNYAVRPFRPDINIVDSRQDRHCSLAMMNNGRTSNTFQTPPPKSRNRQNVEECTQELNLPKTLYLIRHAESEGQAAGRRGLDRQHDPRLRDCPLTDLGVTQAATNIESTLGPDGMAQIELVVTSPLTRALQTGKEN